MCARYIATVVATSNSSADTEDTFIDITAAASTTAIVKRVKVSTKTAAKDDRIRVKIARKSASGAGSAAGTAVPLRALAPTATAGVKVKNGTSSFAAGTITATLDEVELNGRATLDFPCEYETATAGIIGVNIIRSDTSVETSVTVEWEE